MCRFEPQAQDAALGWSGGVACALAGSLAAGQLALRHGFGGGALVATIAALFVLLLPFFLMGTTDLADRLARWCEARRPRVFALVAFPLLPYSIYATGTGTFSWISAVKLTGFVALPLLLVLSARRSGNPPRLPDALAVLAIWLPLELLALRDVWPWPAGSGAFTLNAVLGVDVAVVAFVSIRRLEGVGYAFTIRSVDLREAASNLLFFLAIGLPIGLWTRFISFGHGAPGVVDFIGSFLGIFVAVAIPEELLFRGLIQNLLEKIVPATYALPMAAVIFGLSHLNNGPAPDWRYVLLATIAGVFYGRAYRRSGGLMAACLVHASVDAIWRGFLR